MSYTAIYRLGREPECIGETRNAWRGGMYVWTDVAKRYCGLSTFPMFDDAAAHRVWQSFKNPAMPEHERIVLISTFDNAAVLGRDREAVAAAFEQYGREHPNSSFAEQAAILRAADIQPDDLIAWQQTSVSEFWGQGWDSEKDERTWYDPAERKHFDVYADATRRPAA